MATPKCFHFLDQARRVKVDVATQASDTSNLIAKGFYYARQEIRYVSHSLFYESI